MGLVQAITDAVHTEDNRIGGGALTLLAAAISDSAVTLLVESTIGFGEYSDDGSGDALLAVGDEFIYAAGRTDASFTGCARAQQNTTAVAHPSGARVVDLSQNTSALDLIRRGLLVNSARGADLDVIGRNLGLHRCPGISETEYRRVIREVAYLPKQPMRALAIALEALFPGAYDLYERLATRPFTVFARIDVPAATSLRGRFFLNGGEPHVVSGGQVVTDYPVLSSPFAGSPARGYIRGISGLAEPGTLDGGQFRLNDGVSPFTVFEFDSNGSVAPATYLRPVNFAPGDSEAAVRAATIAAINSAPDLAITAAADPANNYGIFLANDAVGTMGNTTLVTIIPLLHPVFAVQDMAGGQNAGSVGVFAVVEDNARTRRGFREGYATYAVSGVAGSTVSLSSPPADGTAVLVDYTAFFAHYLPPSNSFRNVGDFPPYFADNLLAARCLLDQVRAAGVAVDLAVRIFT